MRIILCFFSLSLTNMCDTQDTMEKLVTDEITINFNNAPYEFDLNVQFQNPEPASEVLDFKTIDRRKPSATFSKNTSSFMF